MPSDHQCALPLHQLARSSFGPQCACPASSSTARRTSHREESPCPLWRRQPLQNLRLFAPCQAGKNRPRSALLVQAARLGASYQVEKLFFHLVLNPICVFPLHFSMTSPISRSVQCISVGGIRGGF